MKKIFFFNVIDRLQGNAPNARTIAGYLEHVALLPAHDSPEVLGLHANADITYQINR